jgi:PTS system cellobiose-specific IIC component
LTCKPVWHRHCSPVEHQRYFYRFHGHSSCDECSLSGGYQSGGYLWFIFPLWFAAIGENAALYAQGMQPVHINMLHTFAAFIVLGGTGATFTLNLLMLGSKSKTLKTLGRTTLVPSFMNINEPLIFGCPSPSTRYSVIPFFINGALINPILVYLAMMTTNMSTNRSIPP